MGLNSARLSLDPVLERCFAGAHRMHAPEENLSVAQLFRDAADSAELTAVNPDLARPQGDGLFPLANDFH
jgi:hypothetical protein